MRLLRLWVSLVVCAVPSLAWGEDLTILVPSSDSAVQAAAEKLADGKKVVYEKKLFKAFDSAAAHLTSCKTCTVTIKVAGGAHTGKGGIGAWTFPEVVTPDATLRILGGWDQTYKKREPFTNPSILVTPESRTAPVITFDGKKHALKELHLSGFAIDVSPGNKYDAKSNSLLKGTSATWTILAFGYLTTDKLIIADNIFMNGAHGAGAPLIRAATNSAEVIVRNNLFLNIVYCWQVKGSSGKNTIGRYLVEGNSFIFNWPYNPDTTTSNPGTLEIGNKYTASLVEIKGNLFAYNFGGAIFPQWDDTQGPKIAIKDNLFWDNGQLFEPKTPGEGAVIGKFNRQATYAALDPSTVEDDFSWDTKGNVVLDPKLPIPVLKLKGLNQKKPEEAEKKEEPAAGGDDLDSLFDDASEIEVDTDLQPEDYADDGKIKNYAPRWPFNLETLPFPKEAKAKKYGADASRVVTP
jgi:hypothetical protein